MKRIKNSLSIDSASTRFSALTGNFTLRNIAVCRLSQSFLLYLITNILLAVSVTTPANAAEALGNSWRRITSIMLCAVFICAFQVLHTAHAADIVCIENGGDAVCTAPEPTAWSYNLCDNAAAYASRHAAWCYTLNNDAQWNGTYGRPPCEGSRIRLTEGLLVPKAEEFTQRVDQCQPDVVRRLCSRQWAV